MLITAAAAGCSGGAAPLARPEATPGAATFEITGSCTISREGNVFTVSGETSIMKDALIDVSIVSDSGMVIDHRTITSTGAAISERFTVTEEQLDGVVDMKGYICCAPSYYGKQPKAVTDVYGSKFLNITNDTKTAVWSNEGVILTFASDWLNGVIPSPTNAPTPVPTATPEASGSPQAAETPSA
jgi:hypothetical protein